jgi:hypothetical protein
MERQDAGEMEWACCCIYLQKGLEGESVADESCQGVEFYVGPKYEEMEIRKMEWPLGKKATSEVAQVGVEARSCRRVEKREERKSQLPRKKSM